MIPDWLRIQMITGLQKLVVLRLPGTPPEDAIPATAQVWLEAMDRPWIKWDQAQDARRVDCAWRQLYATAERWPAPKHLIDLLGNRDPPKALPAPPMSPEEIARNRARLKELIEKFHTVKSITPTSNPKRGQ